MTIYAKLAEIQQGLKAPKGQTNTFGKYQYRKCEDILEAVKPILDGCLILLSDEMVAVGDRVYVKATATISTNLATDNSISVTAFARESLTKKGMDDSQITGSASSYARKYALSGLLAIDNTDDADSYGSKPEIGPRHVTANDQQWIDACRADESILATIADIDYQNFIKGNI